MSRRDIFPLVIAFLIVIIFLAGLYRIGYVAGYNDAAEDCVECLDSILTELSGVVDSTINELYKTTGDSPQRGLNE